MLRSAPATLRGIYNYTLGAFPQFKFAFPLEAIPERITLYLWLLRQNVGWGGILLGLYGMWELLFRRPKRFFLLILMYLVHVIFFIQYKVMDLDVFFIPAHLLFILFIGVGLAPIIRYASSLLRRLPGDAGRRIATGFVQVAMAGVLLLGVTAQVRANWTINDYSDDTAINDFYDNVFEFLPADSVLLGRGGVFGYDQFYYRLVYDVRPDVLMPHVDDPNPSSESLAGRELFTTMRLDTTQGQRGPWALPRGLVEGDVWYIPTLLGEAADGISYGGQRELVLYRISEEPPALMTHGAEPAHLLNATLGNLELVGYDLPDGAALNAGGRLHIVLYWRQNGAGAPRLATLLDGSVLETHQLGLGNLTRYIDEFGANAGNVIVEDYWLVIPSTWSESESTLQVSLAVAPLAGEESTNSMVIDLATLHIDTDGR